MKLWRRHGRNGNERAAHIAKENKRLSTDCKMILKKKYAQLKELNERFEDFKKEKGKQEVAGVLISYVKEDLEVCPWLDEYFLTLVRLTHAFPEEHLAYLFKVSRSTVSRIFLSWLNLLYFELGSIPIWQNKDLIEETMPIPFKETRIPSH